MILPFSTKFPNGNATNFVNKIWHGIIHDPSISYEVPLMPLNYARLASCIRQFFEDKYTERFGSIWSSFGQINPKFHTIRHDAHNRWHAGRMIHMVINNRSKNQFQFAPEVLCTSTQRIDIYETGDGTEVFVDGRCLDENEVEILAKNDGFEDAEHFFNWFDGGIEDYKIIHWTDLRY